MREQIEKLISELKYDEACNLIAKELDLKYSFEFSKNDYHFFGDKDKRDIYKITLNRGTRSYCFNFGQGLGKSGFYAKYSKQKYVLPREKINARKSDLILYVRLNFNRDFGATAKDEIIKPISPTLYDVLACLQKYDVGTFEDFCGDFGYDTDSRSADKIYISVLDEYRNMQALFSDEELEILREIP